MSKRDREYDEELEEDDRPGRKRRKALPEHRLHPDTKKGIWGIVAIGFAIIFALAGLGKAGPVGAALYTFFETLLGVGYFIFPLTLFAMGIVFFVSERERLVGVTLLGGVLLLLSALGLIEIFSPASGGWLGLAFGSLKIPFGMIAAIVMNIMILVIAILVIANIPIRLKKSDRDIKPVMTGVSDQTSNENEKPSKTEEDAKEESNGEEREIEVKEVRPLAKLFKRAPPPKAEDYIPPPLSLLQSGVEKPTTGDLRANANIIKRTLDGFGIVVEMGEVNIGPKVTRYTLKPAEGVKLSRIEALHKDLSLALAAHPIRIEAPIPGKSLVGIEVPNKAAALVRLGSLMGYEEFSAASPLVFVLGRDVTGEPIFADVERMPHLLIAGSTGSGKSVAIHSLIVSLLYKNSPSRLKMVMIDPKRVELSIYQGIPHLVSSVVTENKKAAGVFRWALSEMDRRYDLLQNASSRDVKSYNSKNPEEPIPYLVIIVDELADLMTSYGREIESLIVRLAQMARATGIHLILSTQRPSVEVITGLIKANITSRMALQVASQIDSRTILDMAGAEKLLGGGDLLFVSSDISKPKRIQGAYISEKEINAVADFIREHNTPKPHASEDGSGEETGGEPSFDTPPMISAQDVFEDYANDGDDDELYNEAIKVVAAAKKASASLLQRRLSVGYARAARLLDLMEERGVIGPGDGAKPRDVFIENLPENV